MTHIESTYGRPKHVVINENGADDYELAPATAGVAWLLTSYHIVPGGTR